MVLVLITPIFIVFLITGSSFGFLFDVKSDCVVTLWSDWANVPGLDLHIRERAILRHENMGGLPCPTRDKLREERADALQIQTDTHAHLEATAKSLSEHFIRRKPDADHPNSPNHVRDLLIVIDSLESLEEELFNRTKHNIAKLLGMLCPGPDPFAPMYNHAVLIDASNSNVQVFGKDNGDGLAALKEALLHIPMSSNQSCSAQALNITAALLTSSKGLRSDSKVDKDVLIVTDGYSKCHDDAIVSAFALRSLSRVFSFLIGSFPSYGLRKVINYVSTPVEEHLFVVKTLDGFDQLLTTLQSQNNVSCKPMDLPVDNKN
ncbi:uncharacterized protein LOC132736064 [Ruditapes philippinarum]|uniref:uncharacterized protein LOC132736064 n=1 Tax=Ruditapes philippinarum TaxID=129788 RepID=UPI00295A65A4|nr:uncharacterized protein LOC132736064 [Ruditapes philippinarum]